MEGEASLPGRGHALRPPLHLPALEQAEARWAITQAKLEGPNGEALQVRSLSFKTAGELDVNIIVAEAPPGVEVSSLRLNLTRADGSMAQLQAGDLP